MAQTKVEPTCQICGGELPLADDDKQQAKVVLIKPAVALSATLS